MSENIQVFQNGTLEESENEKMISVVSPKVILCVRDFTLKMDEDEEDGEITEDEYLESCLSCEGASETAYYIRKFFPRRTCFTFSPPAYHKKLKKLGELNDGEMDEDFVTEIGSFKNYINEECPPKKHLLQDELFNGLGNQC